ncbi:carbohydrate-binding module family 1 protein [Poronia punctata]|nr:carbohydrate-binding module family 1 protein [Poronia punctata]
MYSIRSIITLDLLAVLTAAAIGVSAHGHVSNIVINGLSYQGYDPTNFPYLSNPPTVVGWTAENTDNGFVAPAEFSTDDIICHKGAMPAKGYAQVAAGDSISIQWNTWPESHKGPMMDYLAACNGPCDSVDKTTLEFFKIDEAGILDSSSSSSSVPGTWASDVLIGNNNTWLVRIPANIKAGNYVLRHETIALHASGELNGAQNYPQCFNLQVTGKGSLVPEGVVATELYSPTDPGIEVDIYVPGLDYEIPGPALIPGAESTVRQVSSAVTARASATVGSGNGAITTTTRTTSAATTTLAESTTQIQPTKTQTGNVAAQTLYGQCGGIDWTGATTCAKGSCTEYNPYYSQCVEVVAGAVDGCVSQRRRR